MYIYYTKILDMWHSPIRKLLFIMRLIIVLILTTMMQINASTFAQKITYVQKDAPLHLVFKAIKKQTGYYVVWNDDKFDAGKSIDATFKNADVTEVMDKSLKGLPFTYTIQKKTIIIRDKPDIPVSSNMNRAANIDVRGIVHDDGGTPLAGATITIKGTSRSTKTDGKGEFKLDGVDENSILVLSYLGYESREINASENLGIIRLTQRTDKLEEVEINAGYYTVKDKERTGSISRVTSETIAKQPVGNPLAALIGRMAGVNIQQNDGINGGNFNVEIRGRNSLRNTVADNGNQPLYLIDGVPYTSSSITGVAQSTLAQSLSPLSFIAPGDILSIEVLKDADATAIYGSRGANGVILITTKKANTDNTNVDINANQGLSKISKKLELMSTDQYLEMRREAFKNDNATQGVTDYDLNGTWDQNRYTDWQEVLIGGTANLTTIQAAVNGGTENTHLSLRSVFNNSGSVIPGNFRIKTFSNTLTANHISRNMRFKANFSATYASQQNSLPRADLAKSINLAPNSPALYDENGNLNWSLNSAGAATWTNPVSNLAQPYTNQTDNLISNAVLSYEVIPGLQFRTTFGYNHLLVDEKLLIPISSLAPSGTVTGSHTKMSNNMKTWIIEPQVNYTWSLGVGKLETLLGATLQHDQQNAETILGAGFINDLLLENIGVAPIKGFIPFMSQYKYNAIFGRINYNFQGKYIANITARRDGSSRFGNDKQFANFGAIGLAWIISEEEWIKDHIKIISYGKLRSSYGITGNDQIPNYGFMETFSSTEPYKGDGLFPNRIANPDYSWETNKKFEVSMDLGFIRDKILLTTSYYKNRSSNQLVGYTLPDIAGFPSIQYNLPATVENRGWEFELHTSNFEHHSFNWKSSFNLTIPENKLLTYPNIEGSTYASTLTVGSSLYTPKVYYYTGLNSQTGVYEYIDRDGSGTYNINDRIAATKPLTTHLYGGMNNSFTYKRFSLDIFIQAVSKTAKYEYVLFSSPGTAFRNQPTNVLKRWQSPGDNPEFQKYSRLTSAGSAGQRFGYLNLSDRFADASFARLKNVSLSWNAPTEVVHRAKIRNLRLYIQGQNLFTVTNYLGDPETLSILTLPTMSTLSAGIQFTL